MAAEGRPAESWVSWDCRFFWTRVVYRSTTVRSFLTLWTPRRSFSVRAEWPSSVRVRPTPSGTSVASRASMNRWRLRSDVSQHSGRNHDSLKDWKLYTCTSTPHLRLPLFCFFASFLFFCFSLYSFQPLPSILRESPTDIAFQHRGFYPYTWWVQSAPSEKLGKTFVKGVDLNQIYALCRRE